MINLVIADDENRVCRLIMALGEWEKLGIHVVGMAENGYEALELVENNEVDILITDIRMPGYSGLELIEKVKSISGNIKVIIISGYSNFEYAQQAIQCGTNDYLLKPINKDALNAALARIVEQIHQERKRINVLKNTQNELCVEIAKIRRTLITDLHRNLYTELSESILREKYRFMGKPGCYQAFLVKFDSNNENLLNDEFCQLLWNHFEGLLSKSLFSDCYDMVVAGQECWFCGIFNFTAESEMNLNEKLQSVFQEMLVQKDLFGKGKLTVGLGIPVKAPSEIRKSLASAQRMVNERIIVGSGQIIANDVEDHILLGNRILDSFSRKIGYALDSMDIDLANQAIDDLEDSICQEKNAHGWEIYELIVEAGNLVLVRLEILDRKHIYNQFIKDCENSISIPELIHNLRKLIQNQMNMILCKREEETIRPVRIAKNYINQHFQEQISLEEVAEHVGLTPAYFSTLFKKETGEGFAKCIVSKRMDLAKELLRETNLSVREICNRVGYNDIKHFSHTFEKTVGIKPAAYRKLYG